MRAREFINENAKITKRQQSATKGLHLFKDGEMWNTDYTLNRIMMAAASTDGTFVPTMDGSSWVGKYKTSHPYTEQEAEMLKMAYKAAGATWVDVNHGDLNSEELQSTNTQSITKPFKGYKKK